MDALYLEGWLPIILVCIFFASVICIMAKFIKQFIIYTVSAILFLLFVGIFIYSIFGIGQWDGMAIGFYSASALIGIASGTAISPFIKKTKYSNVRD
ncbi:hypothetical protein NC661_19400 [Aquibacillus koreensis]|uniref:YesK-like protein n=1 Tax=Aquibacillus koreensis TaxID=279446 RepID=A0A9X3WMK4_9BACI|nr:YesK family protein [Aquibacillus koreensis]MCT2535357.1 hypothetical protein [Aquibacillus koreensis]MDC3422522.1 hypothetical protein [Aquibacillus koreensis]